MQKEQERNPRKVLGKGLSALLPSRPAAAAAAPIVEPPPIAEASAALPEHFDQFCSIPLDQIRPGETQPRNVFDVQKLHELAQSIQMNGLLQPITVQQVGPKQYRLIAGERRWRAAQIAGMTQIPALVRTVEEQQRLELALIENIQREDLNAIEIAVGFQHLADHHGLSHEQIAERTGKERSTVTNFLRLLRLPISVQNAIIDEHISMGHARVLLGLPTEQAQKEFSNRIIKEGLSVRDTEKLVKNLTNSKKAAPPPVQPLKTVDANLRAALDAMSAALGTKVTLHAKNEKTGRLEIEYYSQEDLERIYSVIVDKT